MSRAHRPGNVRFASNLVELQLGVRGDLRRFREKARVCLLKRVRA